MDHAATPTCKTNLCANKDPILGTREQAGAAWHKKLSFEVWELLLLLPPLVQHLLLLLLLVLLLQLLILTPWSRSCSWSCSCSCLC